MQQLMIVFLVGLASARLSDDKCKESYKKPLASDPSLIKEFPHLGLLEYVSKTGVTYSCPATLISDSFVISPAYCLTSTLGSPKHVLLGTLDPDHKGDNYKLLDVVETIKHPDYTKDTNIHSIALIKFSPPITPSDYIKPGCLYTKNINDNQQPLVDLLWGKSADYKALFKVNSSIVPVLSCKKKYDNKSKIDEQSHLCVNRNYEGEFKRNIGGTSHVYEDGIAKIVAIDNFGPTVPSADYPDVSTNIYNYLDWIEKNVWKP